MTKFLIRLVMSFNALWRFIKVDTEQLEAILTAKLTMDTRRTRAFQQNYSQQKKGQAWLPIFLYLVMGLMFMTFVIIFEDRMTGLTIYFAAFMVMFAMTLITDFTDVLIDVRDNFIILPRPVSDRTITVARILHILLYLFSLLVPYVAPSALYIFIKDGIGGLFIFLLQVLLSVLLLIFLVNLLYLLILQITSPRRFREIINYFQIIFSILIFGCYYLLPKIIDFADFKGASIIQNAAAPFIPPAWIAALWPFILEGKTSGIYLIMSALAVLTPFISIYLVGAVLAKNFNQKMMAIAEGSRENTSAGIKKTARKTSRMHWFSVRLCRSQEEQAGFEWIWMMTQRSRDYKLRVYPSLGIIVIYFIYFFLQGRGTLQERMVDMQGGYAYIFMLYFSSLVVLGALTNLAFSDKYKAGWFVRAMPIPNPGPLLIGAVKAIMIRFFIPIYIILTIIILSFWGIKTLNDCLFGFIGISLFLIVAALLSFRKIPFSESWANMNKGSNFANSMLVLIIGGGLGFLHYLIVNQFLLMLGLSVVFIILAYWAYQVYKRLGWRFILSN